MIKVVKNQIEVMDAANHSKNSVMEAENHLKHGHSVTNHNGSVNINCLFGLAFLLLILSGCSEETPVPEAPTGVSAIFANGAVTISWNAVDGAESYGVFVTPTESPYDDAKDVDSNVMGVTVTTDVMFEGDNYYWVFANREWRVSEHSDYAHVYIPGSSDPNNGNTSGETTIISGTVTGNFADYDYQYVGISFDLSSSSAGDETIQSTQLTADKKFQFTLPENLDGKNLMSLDSWGFNLSVPNVRIGMAIFFIGDSASMKYSNSVDLFLLDEQNKISVNYWYSDKDVDATATFTTHGLVEYDLELKKGWNILVNTIIDGANFITTSSSIPSGVVWTWGVSDL